MQLNFFLFRGQIKQWLNQIIRASSISAIGLFGFWNFFVALNWHLNQMKKAASIDWFLGVPLFAQIVTKCMDDLEQLRLTGGGGGGRFIFNKVIKYLNEI